MANNIICLEKARRLVEKAKMAKEEEKVSLAKKLDLAIKAIVKLRRRIGSG